MERFLVDIEFDVPGLGKQKRSYAIDAVSETKAALKAEGGLAPNCRVSRVRVCSAKELTSVADGSSVRFWIYTGDGTTVGP
jgi:hypothetical protein